MHDPKKILVIRLSSLGDIILSFPLLRALKKKFPGSEIHFLTKKEYEEIVSMNPDIDKVILFTGSLTGMRKSIGKEKFDLIIDIHKNFRSIAVSFANAKDIRRYKKEYFKKLMLVKFKLNLFNNVIPVYEKYLRTVKDQIKAADCKFTQTELNFDRTNSLEYSYVVISPSSRHFTKTYPAEKFAEYICLNADKKFVIVGDNTERDRSVCDYLEDRCKNVINMCGKLNIRELSGIIYNSEYVISNDSSVMHLAEAVGKKVYAIFGSTVKEFGFFPQLQGSKVFEVKGLECRPCTHIGRAACPKGHFKCMMDIELKIQDRH